LLAGVAALILALAGGGALAARAMRPAPPPDIARAMPQDSLGYFTVSMDTDPQTLYASARASMKLAGRPEPEWLTELLQEAREDGVDIEADILPWMGRSFGIAVTGVRPKDRPELGADLDGEGLGAMEDGDDLDPTFGASPLGEEEDEDREEDILLGIAVKDDARARAGLRKLIEADAGRGRPQARESAHDGVQILSIERSGSEDDFHIGVTNQVALMSNRLPVLQAGIDRLKGKGPNLAASPNYSRVLNNLPGRRTAWGYLDTEPIVKELRSDRDFRGVDPSEVFTRQLIGFGLSPMEGGTRLDMYSYSPDAQEAPPAKPDALAGDKLLDVTPQDAIFLYSGEDLSAWWKHTRERMSKVMQSAARADEDDPEGEEPGDMFAEVERETGINLDRDVFGPYTGDFGVTMLPPLREGSLAEGLAMLLETPDPAAARQSLEKLRGVVDPTGERLRPERLNGAEAYLVSELSEEDGTRAGYMFGDGYVAVSPSERTLERLASGGPSLAQSPRFQRAAAALTRRKSALAYVDVQAVLDVVYRDRPGDRERLKQNPAGRYLLSLDTVTLGSETDRDETWSSLLLHKTSQGGR
jgi:hypothetical protein